MQGKCYNNSFSEYYNQQDVVTNSVIAGFQENFILPIYDEYEDDYLDSVPKQLGEDLASSWPVTGENHIAIHDHDSENMANRNPIEGNSLPLSFSSFELLRKGSRVTNQTQESDIMDNLIGFLEMYNEKDEHQYDKSQHMEKPVVCNGGLNHQEEYQGS